MSNEQHDQGARGQRFSQHFHFGTTLHNVFRNINHAFTSNNTGERQANQARDDNRMDDLPPLEPISPAVVPPTTNAVDASASSSHVVAEPSSSTATSADAENPPHSSAPTLPEQDEDDDDSMPELSSITDPSDEADSQHANELLPIDDDHDSNWTDEEVIPPLEPVVGSRRARVEDDVDEARDRRHPSERVGAPTLTDNPPLQPSDPQQPLPPGNNQNIPAGGLAGNLFGMNDRGEGVMMEHAGEDNADPAPLGNNPNFGGAPGVVPILTAGFTFTIPVTGPAQVNQNRTGPTAETQGTTPLDAGLREELLASFTAFFQAAQNLPIFEEAREDPERAKKLVAGLEVVPLGLVKRLERVGGAPGGHIDGSNAPEAAPGCAICWDSLLDAESDGFKAVQPAESATQESSAPEEGADQPESSWNDDAMETDANPAVPSSLSSESSSSNNSPSSEEMRIVTLPCAHVFHASCLIPWFTRAKQATCPTCRFNIDPENLTYTPPPRRTFNWPPGPTTQPAGTQTDPQATQETPPAATGEPFAEEAVHPPNTTPAAPEAPSGTPEQAAPQPAPAAAPFPTAVQPEPRPGAGLPFNIFPIMPGIHIFPFPGPLPLRPPGPGPAPEPTDMPSPPPRSRTQSLPNMADARPTPGGQGPEGANFVTIGLDMFVNMPPQGNGEDADGADGGNNAAPGALPQELHTLLEGIFHTTRNIFPHMMNPQGPAADADGLPQQPQQPQPAQPTPDAAPNTGPQVGPQPQLRPEFFRPMRPMRPRRERKTWTLPTAPGPSLRQRVEQREREEGLRCCDTSCGIGPSDEDPYTTIPLAAMKQVSIHTHRDHMGVGDVGAVCAHTFHPACLVSAERVAGWGGEDKDPLVEVSCPVCRATGYVTRDEWEEGVSAL